MVRAAVAVAAAALIVPVSAQAALSFAFDRAQAHRGQLVRAFEADAEGNPLSAWGDFDASSVTIYLVRLDAPYGRRRELGPMQTNVNGVWSIAFRVPKVRPGLYTTAFDCPPCGNTFVASTLPGTPWTHKPGRVLKITRSRR